MSAEKKKLPIGIEMFKKIRTAGFYYVDKTDFIRELLTSWAEVNLITRPRRFGKSLNMNMLKTFFELGTDPALFEGTRDMVALLEQELGEGDHAPMSVGTEVEHKVFGRGVIVRFDSASQSYRVRFGDNERDLVARVLRQL